MITHKVMNEVFGQYDKDELSEAQRKLHTEWPKIVKKYAKQGLMANDIGPMSQQLGIAKKERKEPQATSASVVTENGNELVQNKRIKDQEKLEKMKLRAEDRYKAQTKEKPVSKKKAKKKK